MVHITPRLFICRRKRTGSFVIINMAIDPEWGAATDWGPLVMVPPSQFQQEGVAVLFRNFEGFYSRRSERGEMSNMSREQQRIFDRMHDQVRAELSDGSTIQLTPMHRVKRGFAGDQHITLTVLENTPSAEFWAILVRAFGHC